jgi:hypothetical protein
LVAEANPSELYFAGVMKLLVKLEYEKARATGKAEEE